MSKFIEPVALDEPQNCEIHGLEFRCTCGACPEQYDVFRDGKQAGYVRLRHGHLRVDVPDCGGQSVLHHAFDDADGCFMSANQRRLWLERAALEILTHPPATDEATQ